MHLFRLLAAMAERRIMMSAYNVKAHPAFSGYDLPEATSTVNRIRRLYRRVAGWTQERRAYYQTLSELNSLSDRDLADIGIARADIPAIARETAGLQRTNS
jgi:uncharacterized protein YjiS (DUF1127 family)